MYYVVIVSTVINEHTILTVSFPLDIIFLLAIRLFRPTEDRNSNHRRKL